MSLSKKNSPLKQFKLSGLVVILSVTAFLGFLVMMHQKSKDQYRYNVSDSYHYNFTSSESFSTFLNLRQGAINLPKIGEGWDTGLLKVRVNATWLGHFIKPNITIKTPRHTFKYGVELGASGDRYLTLQNIDFSTQHELTIASNFVLLPDQDIELTLFKNQDIAKQKVMIISPHPDDAEIAAFGVYSDSNNPFIITVTAGDTGKKNYDEIYQDNKEHFKKKGELRVWNSITIPMLGGVSPDHAINLGYYDSRLDEMFFEKKSKIAPLYGNVEDIKVYRAQNIAEDIKGIPADSRWASLVHDLEYFIDKIAPDVIITPDPFIDSHLDHKLSTIALLEAMRNIGYSRGYLYLYANHHAASEMWPFGKKTDMVNLPPKFNREDYSSTIYSHPLAQKKQHDKLFALEANHDLRLDTEWQTHTGMIKTLLKHFYNTSYLPDTSYYRRAIRSNELFLIVPVEDLYQKTAFQDRVNNFSLKQYKQFASF